MGLQTVIVGKEGLRNAVKRNVPRVLTGVFVAPEPGATVWELWL